MKVDHQEPNYRRRAEQLRKIKEILELKLFSILEDHERMVFLAMEADASTYVGRELENKAGWLYHQTLLEDLGEDSSKQVDMEVTSQSGSSAGTHDATKMEE